MPETPDNKPWLIAAWPGMGNVAVIAAGYLIQKLGARPVAELPPKGHFDVPQVDVEKGLIAVPRLPRSIFHRWTDPATRRELFIFLGEAQPLVGVYDFANLLLDRAIELGAGRVVTFASMASQLHPSKYPRVFGAATDKDTLGELQKLEVKALEDGQIGGLNGVLLGAAADRGIPGLCLLGEIPFFAAGVPNPKAARAVLSVFTLLAGLDVTLEELARHAETVDKALIELLGKLREQAREGAADLPPLPEEPGEGAEAVEVEGEAAAEGEGAPAPDKAVDAPTRARIEQLFAEARKDRNQAMRLKEELDRLGVFEQFEDRFLDLFKRAE